MDDRKDKNENEENESDFWSDALDDIMRRRAWKEWLGEMFDMVMCVMIAAGFTVALTRVFFCISIVSGRSMEPTLQNRDLVVLQRVSRHTDYGDIVACKDRQGELLIKRVIGLEGDVIQIDGPNGVVYRSPWTSLTSSPTATTPATRRVPSRWRRAASSSWGTTAPTAQTAAATTSARSGRRTSKGSCSSAWAICPAWKRTSAACNSRPAACSAGSFKETQESAYFPAPAGGGNEKKHRRNT